MNQSLILLKPSYRFEPISSLSALGKALGFEAELLNDVAGRANGMYRKVKPKPGSTRETFDAKGVLKEIHKRIKLKILVHVYFPEYLHGSVRGRDYFTNADLHKNKQLVHCEDVKKFFPSILAEKVFDIWRIFFGFAGPVATVLTLLTTKDGALPQGAMTSSYLANLAFWRMEPLLHAKLAAQGVTYSRYVDDMAMSSTSHMNKAQQAKITAQVYGMVRSEGMSVGRTKHEVYSASQPMVVTKLIVNRKPSLTKKKRSAIRAQVFQFEQLVGSAVPARDAFSRADKASQSVGQLGRFHRTKGNALRTRVRAARLILQSAGEPTLLTCATQRPFVEKRDVSSDDRVLPWE